MKVSRTFRHPLLMILAGLVVPACDTKSDGGTSGASGTGGATGATHSGSDERSSSAGGGIGETSSKSGSSTSGTGNGGTSETSSSSKGGGGGGACNGPTLPGSFTIHNAIDVGQLQGYSVITGDLVIQANGLTSISLPDLCHVGGSLVGTPATDLVTLDIQTWRALARSNWATRILRRWSFRI